MAALEGGRTFGYALMEPPIPTAVPMKLSPASAAIAPMANSRPVSTHSMALTVSSTPKKAIVVGTLGWKFVDGKESMESMSTPCPVEPPAQHLPPLNIQLRRSNPPIVIVATFQVIAFVSKHLEPLQSASKHQETRRATLALAVDGANINDEDAIIQSLAKQAGLAEVGDTSLLAMDICRIGRVRPFSPWPKPWGCSLSSLTSSLHWTLLTIALLSIHSLSVIKSLAQMGWSGDL